MKSAIEIIASAIEDYDEPWERLIERPNCGYVAAELLDTWQPHQRAEPIDECAYATGPMLAEVVQALNAHGMDTYEERCAEIGKRLVDSVREYIFRVHAMNDADEAERLLAQRRREYQRELMMSK